MPTLTIRISRKESARIGRLAKERRVTKSKLVRDAIAGLDAKREPSVRELWADSEGIVDSGVPDLATNKKYMRGFGRWRE